MTPAEENVVKNLAKRVDQMELADAIDITAIETGFEPARIHGLWRDLGVNPAQERMIEFLKRDHGPCTLVSLLPMHPLARALDLGPGHVYAKFEHEAFIIYSDGGFSPETER